MTMHVYAAVACRLFIWRIFVPKIPKSASETMLALLFATPALRFTPAAVTPKAAATTALAARPAAPVMQMTMMRGERPPPFFVPPPPSVHNSHLPNSAAISRNPFSRKRHRPFFAGGYGLSRSMYGATAALCSQSCGAATCFTDARPHVGPYSGGYGYGSMSMYGGPRTDLTAELGLGVNGCGFPLRCVDCAAVRMQCPLLLLPPP